MEFIDLVCEGISGHIILESQLELSDNSFMEGNFQCDIGNGNRFREPTLDFEDPKLLWIFFLLFFDILLYALNSFYDILDFRKSAFTSDHITDGELKLFFILQSILNFILVLVLLTFEELLKFVTITVIILVKYFFFDILLVLLFKCILF